MTWFPAVRRLGRVIAEKNAPLQTFGYTTTVVTSVTPLGSHDGTYAVTVQINADNVPCSYLAAYINGYTPTIGDEVGVIFIGGAPLILDRVRGFPRF